MISVIVPTYNREDCLYRMLQSINQQKNVDFEVLVIDQSDHVTEEKINRILKSCKHLSYYQINRKGRSISKNFSMGQASGDIVLFCDDDIVAEDNFLQEHVRLHGMQPEVGAISCHLIEPHEKEISCSMPLKITTYGRFINKANAIFNGYVSSLNGGNMSFKRSALEKAGFFEENFRGTSMLEEPDIALRLTHNKFRLYFSSNTKVQHFPQHNGNINTRKGKQYKWQRDYYFNQFYFMLRNKRKKYFPFIFTYLSYRVIVESIENRSISLKYISLPLTSFLSAVRSWRYEKQRYIQNWHTPRKYEVEILKQVHNRHEKIF
jgi:glycosyltransferase involved in cell wall biosynthesis